MKKLSLAPMNKLFLFKSFLMKENILYSYKLEIIVSLIATIRIFEIKFWI